MKTLSAIFLSLALLLAACQSPAPQAKRVEQALDLPPHYQASSPNAAVPQITQNLLQLFDDPQLQHITQSALQHNPDLNLAYAQLEEAGFNLRATRASLYPRLDLSASPSRNGGNNSGTANYSLSLDASWEVDVWGGIRANTRASQADLRATQANYQASQESLAAQTMQAWFTLVSTQKLQTLAQRRHQSFASTENLVQRRYQIGLASLADLELTRTDSANALADLQARIDQHQQAARSLQILCGQYPDSLIESPLHWPSLPPAIPAQLPSQLLTQRPDIAAAYQQILAADARIQVAHADLFPSFALTASGGRSSNLLADLGRSAFNSWSLIANLSAPLFDSGQRRAQLDAAGKRAEQAYHNYRSVLLNAFSEVENALSSQQYLEQEEAARLTALAAAQRAADKTLRDYEAGLTDLLSLLETQRRVFNTEEQTITLQASRLINRVTLALALGQGV